MEPDPTRAQIARGLVTLVILLAYVAVIWWTTVPPWERHHQSTVMRARARRLAGLAARQSGRAAMADEIAAGRPVGWRLAVTERLSRLRDGA